MFRQMPEWQQHTFSEIAFECSRENPRIQVADLLAREAMKVLDNQVGPKKRDPRKSWLALHDTGRFHVEVLSDGWFESLKLQMPMLEKDTGQSRDDYLRWLKTHNMQHSTTNLFQYIGWKARRDNGTKD